MESILIGILLGLCIISPFLICDISLKERRLAKKHRELRLRLEYDDSVDIEAALVEMKRLETELICTRPWWMFWVYIPKKK
jgi:hypothetical protein